MSKPLTLVRDVTAFLISIFTSGKNNHKEGVNLHCDYNIIYRPVIVVEICGLFGLKIYE